MYDRDAVSLFAEQTADASLLRDDTRAPDPEEGLDMLFLTDLVNDVLAAQDLAYGRESTGPAQSMFRPVTFSRLNWAQLLGSTER